MPLYPWEVQCRNLRDKAAGVSAPEELFGKPVITEPETLGPAALDLQPSPGWIPGPGNRARVLVTTKYGMLGFPCQEASRQEGFPSR